MRESSCIIMRESITTALCLTDGSEGGGPHEPSPSDGGSPTSDSTDGPPPRAGRSLSKPQMSRDSAAVKIQAAVRGYLYRKRLGCYLREYKAATLIQAAW